MSVRVVRVETEAVSRLFPHTQNQRRVIPAEPGSVGADRLIACSRNGFSCVPGQSCFKGQVRQTYAKDVADVLVEVVGIDSETVVNFPLHADVQRLRMRRTES